MADFKIYLVIIGVAAGLYLLFQPKIAEFLANVKASEPTPNNNTPKVASQGESLEDSLVCLESVINKLDKEQDKDKIDYLIEQVGVSLVRKRFGR